MCPPNLHNLNSKYPVIMEQLLHPTFLAVHINISSGPINKSVYKKPTYHLQYFISVTLTVPKVASHTD